MDTRARERKRKRERTDTHTHRGKRISGDKTGAVKEGGGERV